ncbi:MULTISPECIES: C1 family peptidase [Sphingobium]|uniref:Peptidase C1 n=1 Tax=Sphingobium baderi TaxID=1332080 RepID=A0A0S3EW37_9SPHN|nr:MULTISPECIES: C1 family peptidase [Sphingobium]ALR19645.1 peptidase C1 [Sphingobium baderi]
MIEITTDLRLLFGAARDQGARPTCMAFAASDAHAGLRDGWAPLSCEFAFYHAQRRAGRSPAQGALLSAMLDALRGDGQPEEHGWPYLEAVPEDHGLWNPPAVVGDRYGRDSQSGTKNLASIIALLDTGRPVVILTMLSRSFFMPAGDGVVDPANDEQPEPSQRHAVIAVGHGKVDGTTAILVRNSWGTGWGLDGHAWLTERFLAPRLFATANLMEEVDVSSSTLAA